MNCPRCACPNDADAQFCKNCGMQMYYYPPVNPGMPPQPYAAIPPPAKDPTINYFIILLSYDVLRSLWWLVFTRLIIPALTSGDHYERYSSLYAISNWITNGISILLVFVFAAMSKNRTARIFFFCYGGISVLLFLLLMYWKL